MLAMAVLAFETKPVSIFVEKRLFYPGLYTLFFGRKSLF
jgi:hypothetical protein